MTKTDIGIYRGLKEKFDPEVHVGFFITTDTGELLVGDQSLGQTISGWEINDGVLKLKLNTGRDILVTFPEASETVKGLLSAADKAQLIALQGNLNSKVDKVTGKSLVEDTLITKLTGLPTSETLTLQLSDAKTAGTDALTAVTAEVTRAKAAEEAIQTALDNHKADKDKKHIPTGGHERQILAWESDGTAKWDDLSNMFTGMEELLAYGVEWDITVADPHLTRIGNMSLHKTLPIQSQLKGCIALGDKVIYWLNEKDWRYRKDPIIIRYTANSESNLIQSSELASLIAVGLYLKITTDSSTSYLRLVYVRYIDNNNIIYFNAADGLDDQVWRLGESYNIEIGSRLDGYDGTVRVYCPNFYIKSERKGNKRRVWLSTVKIDNTWTYQHEILIDAYRSTALNTVPENMGYLSTLPVNSAISVVNTATYCRGGDNRTANDKYLTGADDTTIDIFRTDLGKPRTNLGRHAMRRDSRNAGNEMLSYNLYKNIFYWLYVVEYANFNCQEAYNEALTDEGYKQGGLGAGITNMNHLNLYNGYYPLTPCGYGNEIGNGTGIKPLVIPEFTTNYGPVAALTFSMPRWRGFDNPFGDIWTNLDGIIILGDAAGNPKTVYTTTDPNNYGDNEAAKNSMEIAGHEIHQDGYTKEFDLGDAAHIIPESVGGDSTKYKCDYHLTGNRDTSLRTLLVGGHANNGAYAGLGYFYSHYGVSTSSATIGFRSVSAFVSFSE